MRAAKRALVAVVALIAGVSAPGAASAQDKSACVAAYEKAQIERQQGHLKSSREQASLCSRATCPAVLQRDCVGWLREIDAALPSVVIEAVAPDGRETLDVHVTCDGVMLADRLDGRAIPMDPGEHSCRFDLADAKKTSATEKVVLHEGDQRKRWRVTFPPARTTVPPPPSTSHDERGVRIPAVAWILGGIGLVVAGAGTVLELRGFSKKDELDRCRPDCTQGLLDEARASFILGDISLAIGVLAFGGAVLLTYMSSTGGREGAAARASSPRVFVGAGRVGLGGSF